jgi:hypothetical protein
VVAHLENKCPPACRMRQMQALLAEIKEDKSPVVVAGDLNTSSSDNTPISIRNEIMTGVTDYQFWIGQPFPIVIRSETSNTRFTRCVISTGTTIRQRCIFRSYGTTGSALYSRTWRGFASATIMHSTFEASLSGRFRPVVGPLAHSNQRSWKSFAPTYAFSRDFAGLVGRFKLDWVFGKPFINEPRRAGQSFRFAPHFPVTMRELNESVDDRVSDPAPMTVDLPLTEPPKTAAERGQP